MTQHRAENLPRTLYLMSSMCCKRSVSFNDHDDSPQEGEAKRLKITGERGILSMPPDLTSFLSLESRYLPNQYRVIPLVELMKAWELILDQVDWSEVVQKAEGRESPDTYRDVFRTIMHSYVEELLKQEKYRKDIKIELGDDENGDTESENDSSEDGDGEDNTLLESDESGYGSEDYIDDETDDKTKDEEDSDDEDEVDDGCEVIDDWESV